MSAITDDPGAFQTGLQATLAVTAAMSDDVTVTVLTESGTRLNLYKYAFSKAPGISAFPADATRLWVSTMDSGNRVVHLGADAVHLTAEQAVVLRDALIADLPAADAVEVPA